MLTTQIIENEIETIKARINELEDQLPHSHWYVSYTCRVGELENALQSTKVYAPTEERARGRMLEASTACAKIVQSYELNPR